MFYISICHSDYILGENTNEKWDMREVKVLSMNIQNSILY